MKLYCEDVERALEQAQSSREGLTTAEAQQRLAANGRNKLAEAKKDSLVKRFFRSFPMRWALRSGPSRTCTFG